MKALTLYVIFAMAYKVSCDPRKCKAIIYSMQTIQSIPEQSVILKCRCEFCDEEIFWLKNGSILNLTTVRHHSNNENQLILNGSNEEIGGNYSCTCGESRYDEMVGLGESMEEGQRDKHLQSIAIYVAILVGVLIVAFVSTMCVCYRKKLKFCLKKNRDSGGFIIQTCKQTDAQQGLAISEGHQDSFGDSFP